MGNPLALSIKPSTSHPSFDISIAQCSPSQQWRPLRRSRPPSPRCSASSTPCCSLARTSPPVPVSLRLSPTPAVLVLLVALATPQTCSRNRSTTRTLPSELICCCPRSVVPLARQTTITPRASLTSSLTSSSSPAASSSFPPSAFLPRPSLISSTSTASST